MRKSQITNSAQETQAAGAQLAQEILSNQAGKLAVVLALSGNLGAGKTTFLQGFARGLGIAEVVNSPTFIVMKKFQITNHKSQTNSKFKIQNSKFSYFYHIDCYRLEDPQEMLDLGFHDIIASPENIVAIEWPERIKKVLPKNIVAIRFSHGAENTRTITLDYDRM